MEFLAWHYTSGLRYYIRSWLSSFNWISHYFSPLLLLKTLFSPWKRLIVIDTSPGFNFQKKFEAFTFNLISRGVGAVVRLGLFFAGIVLITFSFLGGAAGLVFWITVPLFGLSIFQRYKRQPVHFVEELVAKLKSNKDPLRFIFASEAGSFVLSHCQLELDDLVGNANKDKVKFAGIKPEGFRDIVARLVESDVWPQDYFDKKELEKEDLILAAFWWDQKRIQESQASEALLGRPGLALELTFGYTPTLNQYSSDLSISQPFSHRLIGRQQVVSRMERILVAGKSVLLMGQPGVGKKTVVLEFANRAVTGQLGPKMAYRRILELDYNSLLSEAVDLNLKKTKLAQILAEGAAAGNVILVVRDIHRLTNPEVEGYDFTDVFDDYLEKRELKIIAISTNVDYERFVSSNMRLRKYIEMVEVTQPTKEEATQILIEFSQKQESSNNLVVMMPALRNILEESDRYVTEVPFPEKALELLDAVVTYCMQKGSNIITPDDVRVVLAEKTGISFAKLTGEEKERLGRIEEIIHERLINQEAAIGLIGKALRAKTVGVVKEDRPLGSFLFLGPTGVGKTETAKVLAKVYYGSQENIIRFDMAEYSGSEGLERLVGSVSKSQPGVLTTAIKNRPASLLLLDEIEKAKADIYNLFLALLDEGKITDAFGKQIIGRHLFVIGTSNAAAEFIRQSVNKGIHGEQLQKSVVNHVLESQIFSPEFLNRFDGVVVYEPLKKDDLVKIAHLMLADLAENLRKKNINLQVSDEVAKKLAEDGYEPAFGARPMRRMVNLDLGDLIGKVILGGELKSGDKIKILPGNKKGEFKWEKI
jgi:ATP-dependent Clp protease ATP-binding subunit ClpC